jgi:quinol-cytochrome oxidoreductase complex cytochrome b subunit
VVCVTIGIVFFFVIPFVDRASAKGERKLLFTAIGLVYLLYFVAMTLMGYWS